MSLMTGNGLTVKEYIVRLLVEVGQWLASLNKETSQVRISLEIVAFPLV